MNRKSIGLLVALMIVVAVAAAVLLFSMFRADSPFEGQRSIDLGVQEMHGEPVVFRGEFELRNVSGTAVHVLALRPNCGCVQAELPRKVIPAGELLEIPFTMTLERHGKRRAYIDVLLPEERVEQLRLDAEARETYRITAAPRDVALRSDEPATLALIVEVHAGENPPPQPVLEAPQHVTAEFQGWTELEGRRLGGAASRRWRGEVVLSLAPGADATNFSDATLTVRLDERDSATVRVFAASFSD